MTDRIFYAGLAFCALVMTVGHLLCEWLGTPGL
jgi:hypothetical protein